jgi:hypothetical protein
MGARGARASEVGIALDERRFAPPNLEARPSASGARRRSYTRCSEVGIPAEAEFITITITITGEVAQVLPPSEGAP